MKRTEERNPRSMKIDKVDTLSALQIMSEENKVPAEAVEKALPEIAKAVDMIVNSFNRGGRLLYIGAGTSGRLGVLDASECPPTFATPAEQVVGIIAGGVGALVKAVEGAEDNGDQGVEDVKFVNISNKDTLVGISVSGDASYIVESLRYAKSIGAHTVSLTCNYDAKINTVSDVNIVTDTGPEVITGSTRLKAGTAHKMVLNMLTTIAMVRTGKVIENLMVNVAPTNIKLFARAKRIIVMLTGIDDKLAEEELMAGHTIREVVEKYGKK